MKILIADHKIIGILAHSDYFWAEETRGSLACGHHPVECVQMGSP